MRYFAILSFALMAGCASVPPGPADQAAEARKVKASSTSAAIYFCREWAFAGSGVLLYPRVNGKKVATMTTKTFTRIDLPPGGYEIALGYYDINDSTLFKSLSRDPVKMEDLNVKSGEIYTYWIGMAGSSLFGGSLTIDRFDNKAQAADCINSSTYISPSPVNL